MIAAAPTPRRPEYHCAARSPLAPQPENASSYWPGCRSLNSYRPPLTVVMYAIPGSPSTPTPPMAKNPELCSIPGVVATTQTPSSPLPELDGTRPLLLPPGCTAPSTPHIPSPAPTPTP